MEILTIENKLREYQEDRKKLFTTSSFQTHSVVLLHILSKIDKNIPVFFINTGFHFPETLTYRDQIVGEFGLNLKVVQSVMPRVMQKNTDGNFLFSTDPDFCCHINKVEPMEPILQEYDVWINGVRADQSEVRKEFKIEQTAKYGCLRFHPILDWDKRMIYQYIKQHQIPRHPLEQFGYRSIGCEPCTRRPDLEWEERQGRWFGMNKTECGLNTELVTK
ncbi:MAG TPA: phosphoadenylyl-sulfate reductase [Cytophagales bacterium]|nr:phosphoadenylyl-sulfate reductase [Cytophagales bacterium]